MSILSEGIGLLPYAAPVGFAAIGEVVGQKSGLINIGLEGMMLNGAYFALIGCTVVQGTGSIPLGFLFAVLTTILLALLSGYFTVVLAMDQVVVGTAINLFALGLTSTLFRAKYGQTGQLLSLPTLPRWHGVDAMILFLFLAIPVISWLLKNSGWGLALRASGEYPKSVEASGFSVVKIRLSALMIGGIFAGLGGAYLVLGTTGSFAENMTAGRGFLAIALVTFGRWKPGLVLLAAIFLGFLDSLQFKFQALGIHFPYQLLIALPYAGALLFLVIVGKKSKSSGAPASLGIPFRRNS